MRVNYPRKKSYLVRRSALSYIASATGLTEYMVYDLSSKNHSGYLRTVFADTIEAFIGAVYVDGGVSGARDVVLHCWNKETMNYLLAISKNNKTIIQQWTQSYNGKLPIYVVKSVCGPEHCPVFNVELNVDGISGFFCGEGTSKKNAEQNAAGKMVKYLQDKGVL